MYPNADIRTFKVYLLKYLCGLYTIYDLMGIQNYIFQNENQHYSHAFLEKFYIYKLKL